MVIREATVDDMDTILDIYLVAREFMQATGNKNQWMGDYPSRELIWKSIQEEKHYVCMVGDQIAGTFYFSIEDDISYAKIYEGKWLNDKPYGVVHRLASGGICKGVARFCLRWCFEQCNNIRIDTHRDNTIMQGIVKKEGYGPCGIIFVQNGTERLAFQKY